MRALITGSDGQLGSALMRQWPAGDAVPADLPDFDITDSRLTYERIGSAAVDVVIHAAAITNVDACARDPELAFRVNAFGTQNVALACAAVDVPLLLISTNEVFAGTKAEPYLEFDSPGPINPYARSKLAAEWYAQQLLNKFYIVRTAWMYADGGRNFVHNIQQHAIEDQALRVVTDEVGSPTYAEDLAAALIKLVATNQYGIYHLVNAGQASRFDFARKVLDLTGHADIAIEPTTLADYQRASIPPPYSVLANTAAALLGIVMRSWEEALEEFLKS